MEQKLTVNSVEYHVCKLLGKDKGGYSYLVSKAEEPFVLKQIHHEPCDYYQFGNKMEAELRDYKRLCEIGIKMPKLLDVDMEQERRKGVISFDSFLLTKRSTDCRMKIGLQSVEQGGG